MGDSVSEDDKITFEMPIGNALFSQTQQFVDAYNHFKDFLKSVDPRLNMVAAVNPTSESSNNDVTVAVDNYSLNFYVIDPNNGQPFYN